MTADPAQYPAHREADVVLKDGSTARIRPVRESDAQGIETFLRDLSDESRYYRFFSGAANVGSVVRWAIDVDYRRRYGLVVTTGANETVIAHASYTWIGDERAEIALEVGDTYQRRGLGGILLGHLAEAAAENGIAEFRAEVLPANHSVIELFRRSGFPLRMRSEPGEIVIEFPVSLNTAALDRFERRDQMAAVAALRGFLVPRSVAVLGASRRRGSIGGEVFHNLLDAGFNGPVYPVNPKADVVQSVRAYKTVADVPDEIDLGVIVVPASEVEDVARQCGEKGVRSLVVISAGFGEIGAEGRDRQHHLMEICREHGVRLIGPNCMGILNTAPDVSLNATFAPAFPPRGRVGFMSQSGALGLSVIDYAGTLGLGLSSFVSVGNKADISGNDLIHYWETDEDTDLILLYLESFGNPRTFARIARRVSREKPIIVVKSGRSAAGARATSSHTGALLAASDVTVDALFRQAGVVRTDTLAEMFDVAALLANQPAPQGKRVAIVTNAGGPGILCADACEALGLQIAELPETARTQLSEFLPGEAALMNPVDMIASASAEDYRRAIEILAGCDEIDALIVIFIPPLVTRAQDVARAIRRAATAMPRAIPLLTVFMSARGVPAELRGDGVRIPSYAFPEDAARALARATAYGMWRTSPEGTVPDFGDVNVDRAASVIAGALTGGERWLDPQEVAALLECYRLPLAEQRRVRTPAEAGRAARELGGVVVLKAIAPGVLHKTEAGGVRLGLHGPTPTERAASEMRAALRKAGHAPDAFLVQRMADPGVEMLVGVVHDPSFGPVVAVGAGGTAVELLRDARIGISPLTDLDADEMITSLATYPLLRGFRGAEPADVDALREIVLRVSAMVEAHPEIAEMDLNPVIVHPSGATVVDARVRVAVPPKRLPIAARRPV